MLIILKLIVVVVFCSHPDPYSSPLSSIQFIDTQAYTLNGKCVKETRNHRIRREKFIERNISPETTLIALINAVIFSVYSNRTCVNFSATKLFEFCGKMSFNLKLLMILKRILLGLKFEAIRG